MYFQQRVQYFINILQIMYLEQRLIYFIDILEIICLDQKLKCFINLLEVICLEQRVFYFANLLFLRFRESFPDFLKNNAWFMWGTTICLSRYQVHLSYPSFKCFKSIKIVRNYHFLVSSMSLSNFLSLILYSNHISLQAPEEIQVNPSDN